MARDRRYSEQIQRVQNETRRGGNEPPEPEEEGDQVAAAGAAEWDGRGA